MPEPEIWYIILALASACLELQKFELYHGDIQPGNILITNDEEIKLIDAPAFTQFKDGWSRVANKENWASALSPQQLEDLRNDRDEMTADREKSDVYSIGITVLCAVSNNPLSSFYNYGLYEVIDSKIGEKLELMEHLGYSIELRSEIAKCIRVAEKERPTFQQLVDLITPYCQQHDLH